MDYQQLKAMADSQRRLANDMRESAQGILVTVARRLQGRPSASPRRPQTGKVRTLDDLPDFDA